MKEKLFYQFQIKVFGNWVSPIEGKFYGIRDCWKFAIRNKRKYEKYKQRIVGFNEKNNLSFALSITLSRLSHYEDHLKIIKETS